MENKKNYWNAMHEAYDLVDEVYEEKVSLNESLKKNSKKVTLSEALAIMDKEAFEESGDIRDFELLYESNKKSFTPQQTKDLKDAVNKFRDDKEGFARYLTGMLAEVNESCEVKEDYNLDVADALDYVYGIDRDYDEVYSDEEISDALDLFYKNGSIRYRDDYYEKDNNKYTYDGIKIEENLNVRTKLYNVKMMHEVMMHMNDEEAYMTWIYTMPDNPDEYDFKSFAENEEEYQYLVKTFERIFNRYKKHGIYQPTEDIKKFLSENNYKVNFIEEYETYTAGVWDDENKKFGKERYLQYYGIDKYGNAKHVAMTLDKARAYAKSHPQAEIIEIEDSRRRKYSLSEDLECNHVNEEYDLVGVDGNAFSVMGYVSRALNKTGHRDLIDEYREKAMSSDYDNLLRVSLEYIDIANASLDESCTNNIVTTGMIIRGPQVSEQIESLKEECVLHEATEEDEFFDNEDDFNEEDPFNDEENELIDMEDEVSEFNDNASTGSLKDFIPENLVQKVEDSGMSMNTHRYFDNKLYTITVTQLNGMFGIDITKENEAGEIESVPMTDKKMSAEEVINTLKQWKNSTLGDNGMQEAIEEVKGK